jgi:hypothetical protein
MTPDEGEPQDTTRKLIGAGIVLAVFLGCVVVICAAIILVVLLMPRTGGVFSGMDSI